MSLRRATPFHADGTAAAPSISFLSTRGLGFYRAGSNVMGLSAAQLLGSAVGGDFVIGNTSGGALCFNVNGGAVGRFESSTGALLLGFATSNANGRLQLATHTTAAGGIGFGSDTSLFRIAAGQLAFASAGTANFVLQSAGVNTGQIATTGGGGVFLDSLIVGGAIIFRSGATVTALQLDANQNALFSGQVICAAGVAGRAGLRVTHGVAPSAPVDGDVWSTSAGGLFIRVNGVTKTVTLT